LNLTVGSDVALVSCDEVPLAELHTPPITVIERDPVRMGELAAELLLERMGTDGAARRILLPTSLVIRDSTRSMSLR